MTEHDAELGDDLVRLNVGGSYEVSLEALLDEIDDAEVAYEVRSAVSRLQASLVEVDR